MKMHLGSKEKNTPSSFNEKSAMWMNGNGDGDGLMGGDVTGVDDPKAKLGDPKQVSSEITDIYKDQKPFQYQPTYTSDTSTEGWGSAGSAIGQLLKPKKGEEGYARQKERQADRKISRAKRGGITASSDTEKKVAGWEANPMDKAIEKKEKWQGEKGTQTKVGGTMRNWFGKKNAPDMKAERRANKTARKAKRTARKARKNK